MDIFRDADDFRTRRRTHIEDGGGDETQISRSGVSRDNRFHVPDRLDGWDRQRSGVSVDRSFVGFDGG